MNISERFVGRHASIRDVKEELLRLPTKRYEVYRIAIARIREQSQDLRDLGMRILAWVIYARVPMRVPQLQHAIATRPGDEKFDEEGIIAAEELMKHTTGLLTIQNDKVHCVHHTVEEFLREPEREKGCFAGAREDIARTCFTYTHFKEIKDFVNWKDIQQLLLDYLVLEYAALQWRDFAIFGPEFQAFRLGRLLKYVLMCESVQGLVTEVLSGGAS